MGVHTRSGIGMADLLIGEAYVYTCTGNYCYMYMYVHVRVYFL